MEGVKGESGGSERRRVEGVKGGEWRGRRAEGVKGGEGEREHIT